MASKPGILTEWPWTWLGNFKYAILAPSVVHSTYSYLTKDETERDITNVLLFPLLLWRALHNQMWISFSRHRTAKGNNRIVDKSIEFEQVDRERNWDDQILLNGVMFYLVAAFIKNADHLPLWRTEGALWMILLHAGPVEFLYYWLHRALHHHYLYSRYHSHHHSSIVTEPITSVIHPFAEHVSYFVLFSIPIFTTLFVGNCSILAVAAYLTYIDFMNNMGHCNFELVPKWLFSVFPPLKFLMYTPSYHSLHHTQFRTNYSLFMPFFDYVYCTMDKSSDTLYENSLLRDQEEAPDVVHLTHLTTPESMYQMRLGFPFLASEPHKTKWYLWLMWPITLWSMLLTWIYGRTFTLERNIFKHLKSQTWVIPKYTIQYCMERQRESVNRMIEAAVLEADGRGAKVLSLGLLNQDEGLNGCGEIFLRRNPQLKVRLVDGSSLAVAIVLNSIPTGTTKVILRGKFSKIGYSIALALCQGGTQVYIVKEDEHKKLKAMLSVEAGTNLILSKKNNTSNIWLVGDDLTEDEQKKAAKGTLFVPFSQFPPKKQRKDCFYHTTPSMLAPKHLKNVDSCENWLPRRVMSAGRIAGLVHAMEEWDVHECGAKMFAVEKVWKASLEHGFRPLTEPVDRAAPHF